MKRHIGVGALLVLLALVIAWTPAASDHRDHCPPGKIIHSVNFHTRTIDCISLARLLPALGFITVDHGILNGLAGPHLIITGVNVHIRSGSGATDDNPLGASPPSPPLGLGNLVMGYNEENSGLPSSRGGSHNLIVGPEHQFPSVGGFLAGRRNETTGTFASVTGGQGNSAGGTAASVSGGRSNNAAGMFSSISGGSENGAVGAEATVTGGAENGAIGALSHVSGGVHNRAIGAGATVTGGLNNTATGGASSVSGGTDRDAPDIGNWVGGGLSQPN